MVREVATDEDLYSVSTLLLRNPCHFSTIPGIIQDSLSIDEVVSSVAYHFEEPLIVLHHNRTTP
ncbi:hypothetical protein BaRGS_00015167, partial [Batillaria attramentaria]